MCHVSLSLTVCLQVECKKAQPKEVVQAANTAALLGKRVILSNLGILPGLSNTANTAASTVPQPQPQLSPAPALQAALQQQLAASAALGTVLCCTVLCCTVLNCPVLYFHCLCPRQCCAPPTTQSYLVSTSDPIILYFMFY